MPIDYNDYPDNWFTDVRPRILSRANNCCERCGVANRVTVWRHPDTVDCWHIWTTDRKVAIGWYMPKYLHGEYLEDYGHRVALTIAHIYDDNPHNVDDDNLQALCQTCHLRLDAQLHARNQQLRKNQEREQAGQLRLFS